MPAGDRTGPNGQGSMTGRGAGYCAGFNTPGYANSMPRRGMGFGRGRGMGFGRATMYNPRGLLRPRFMGVAPVEPQPVYQEQIQPIYPQQQYKPTKEQETDMLEQEAKAIGEEQKAMKQELEAIKKRMEELKKQK